MVADERPARVFVDSGAWIALLSRRDTLHAEAERTIRTAVQHGVELLTTNLVLAEVQRAVLFRMGPRAATAALERMVRLAGTRVEFETAEHHRAAVAWLQKLADQALTYTDAVSFAIMTAAHCTQVVGFDRHFAVAGFVPWQPR
jgi:predicted nucleic acid-binding protein